MYIVRMGTVGAIGQKYIFAFVALPSTRSMQYLKQIILKPNCRRGRVGIKKGVGHLAHVWSYGVREVVSLITDRCNIVG